MSCGTDPGIGFEARAGGIDHESRCVGAARVAIDHAGGNGRAPEPLLVSEREAARLLGISPRLMWSLGVRGEIPRVRLGGRVLYALKDLRAVIEKAKGRR
ncbi:MAG: helix-turn-helix domain-containing protein [Planctomycetota bacterium]